MVQNVELNVSNNKFISSLQIPCQDNNVLALNTENKFLDKNIELNFYVNSGSVTAAYVAATAIPAISISANGCIVSSYESSTTVNYSVTPGWISTIDAFQVNTVGTATHNLELSTLSTTSVIPETTASQTVIVGAGYYPTTRTIAVSGMSSGTQAILGSEGSVTTAPYVTIGGTNTMEVSTTPTLYYFTRTGSVSAGTVQTKYKATQGGYTPAKDATNGGTVTVTPNITNDATIYIKSGSVISSITGGGITHSVTPTNIELDNTNTSGIEMHFGSSAATATASITKTTGYIEGGNLSNFIAASTAVDAVYVKGVTLQKPVSGTSTFYITFPNGADDTMTFHFEVDSEGNVTIN